MALSVVEGVIVFVVSLLVGGFGIYVGARVIAGDSSYEHAVVTALIGAVVWAVAAFLFGWIPFLGPLVVFVAYLGVINWQYPGGWGAALGIALIAWLTSLVALYLLSFLGFSVDALGVAGA
jgi:hypothetical protein